MTQSGYLCARSDKLNQSVDKSYFEKVKVILRKWKWSWKIQISRKNEYDTNPDFTNILRGVCLSCVSCPDVHKKNFNQNKNMPSLNCFITFHYLVIFSSKREIVVWRQLYSLNNSNKHLAITAFIAAPAMSYKLNSTSGNKERLLKWEDEQRGEKQPSEREILD